MTDESVRGSATPHDVAFRSESASVFAAATLPRDLVSGGHSRCGDPGPTTLHQLAAQHGHRMTDQDRSRSFDADLDHSAATRNLVGRQLRTAELFGPVRAEAAMRRATDRIFVDADPRREEPRHQVVLSRARASWSRSRRAPGYCSSRRKSGRRPRTISSLSSSTRRSNRFLPANLTGAPSADCSLASSPGSDIGS